jgi:transcriptional regulator with XRE-family HTH domain
MALLLAQIKRRRLQLSLKQQDMYMRVGISRQQYHRIENKGNPRLDTLELIAQGLSAELMLIPKEHVAAVNKLMEKTAIGTVSNDNNADEFSSLVDDPWKGLI